MSETIPGLFDPPADLYELSGMGKGWDAGMRIQTLQLKKDNPDLLIASLRHWVLTAMHEATKRDLKGISTRRLSRIVFGLRSLTTREFVELLRADSFSEAIYLLTGVQVGHYKIKQGAPSQTAGEDTPEGGKAGETGNNKPVNARSQHTLQSGPSGTPPPGVSEPRNKQSGETSVEISQTHQIARLTLTGRGASAAQGMSKTNCLVNKPGFKSQYLCPPTPSSKINTL